MNIDLESMKMTCHILIISLVKFIGDRRLTKNCRTQYHIFARPKEPPSICSDFPIIFKKNNLIKVYENDYIFDLSQNRIFVKRNLTQRFNHQLHYLINLISLKQSVNDVATSDESYIDFLIKLDNENNCTLEEYKKNLFNELI